MMEQVILIDENDNEIGLMEKLEAHQKGLLHRAFSVLIFNSKGELLLQKRADGKYHSAGLWTNTCCSHPLPNENMADACKRRLKQEMGIEVKPVYAFKFLYKIKLDNGLTEHELDHVYFGVYDDEPYLNEDEASDWMFVNIEALKTDMQQFPEKYTHWFQLIIFHPEFNPTLIEA
ncbi:MAG TPA: isopentenyl-diphosphate Delta-isomerase [Cyclobacteriaceae bacterium]|nr:isopentenyl-diphosphate Delta-isomerase [Cyclobacteriaceae bacterium]